MRGHDLARLAPGPVVCSEQARRVDEHSVAVTAPILAASPSADLIAALKAADPEPVIEQAFRHITTRGAALPLLLAVADAMARAGLAGLATTLLRSAGERACANDSICSMLDRLEELPSGELRRDEMVARFRCNVSALETQHGSAASVLRDAQLPHDIRIYRSRAGNLHAARKHSTPQLETVFPFIDFRATASAMRLPPADLTTSYLLVGVPARSGFTIAIG
jgi:hypothetical protein